MNLNIKVLYYKNSYIIKDKKKERDFFVFLNNNHNTNK